MTDINVIAKANDLRERIARGEEVSKEELAETYAALRSNRVSASESAKKTSRKKKEEVPSNLPSNLGDLFS